MSVLSVQGVILDPRLTCIVATHLQSVRVPYRFYSKITDHDILEKEK